MGGFVAIEFPRTDFEHDGLSITQKVCPRRPLSVRRNFERPIGSNNEITRLVYKPIRITSLSLRRAGRTPLGVSSSTAEPRLIVG